ncbi:ScyD/ScyE family protein [Hymenobacter terricola]|uniref:ScyD/ScyE family protein n=1 Tax=Hymenobacter terricola TaxID=2819236 RepID=UPI001B317F93|nr:ScyD/ScyE family protein [Hymenobacter terricola]
MKSTLLLRNSTFALGLLLAGCTKDLPNDTIPQPAAGNQDDTNSRQGRVTVFARGLNNPRGLKFGPNGYLYVAEGGVGGTHLSTLDGCQQVPIPVGPYKGSPTGGRISKINPAGVRTTVTDQLPSSQANEIIGGDVEGVGDVAFVGNTLYAVLAGAGCSHGVPSMPNALVRVGNGGHVTMVANISAYLQAHPVAHPEVDDFEPDGTPYSLINRQGILYVVEPNHGELMKITTSGTITRVADISASQGHIVPTALVAGNGGSFIVGNLNPFPIVVGSSSLYKINRNGRVSILHTGFTTILGLAYDSSDRLYVLENTVGAPGPTPGLGRVVRVEPSGRQEVVATGLNLPTAMTMGPDGNLYVSNNGFGPTSIGGGEIVKIRLSHDHDGHDHDHDHDDHGHDGDEND